MTINRRKRPLLETVDIPAGEPTWLTRERRVPVPYAANLRGISEDAFRRNYPSLIEDISERRQGVKLGSVLDLGQHLS
jgi:hypothetical protein